MDVYTWKVVERFRLKTMTMHYDWCAMKNGVVFAQGSTDSRESAERLARVCAGDTEKREAAQ